jgi:hypothetical protein
MPDWDYLARLEEAERNRRIAADTVASVVHDAPGVISKESVVVHVPANDDRYRDKEARKDYRREWMRAARRKALKTD